MCHRDHQMDVAHALPAHLLFSHFHPASITDDPFVTDTLVLSTGAFIVFYRTKDALAEQPVAFRFIRPVVDRLRLQHFSAGTFQNDFRRRKADRNFREITFDLLSWD